MTASGAPPELPKQPGGGTGQKRVDGYAPAKIQGIELPVQYWAGGLIAVLLIVGLDLYAVKQLQEVRSGLQEVRSDLGKSSQRNAEPESKSPTKTPFDEAQVHANEKPVFAKTLTLDRGLSLLVEYLQSDGCFRVTRIRQPGTDPNERSQFALYIPDRLQVDLPAPGRITGDNWIGRPGGQEVGKYGAGQAARLIHASVSASSASSLFGPAAGAGTSTPIFASASDQRSSACNGTCQNPHPGQFKTWNGETRGCWLQVWRQWPDGCTHYQWYNTCNSYWDANIYWTCCVH